MMLYIYSTTRNDVIYLHVYHVSMICHSNKRGPTGSVQLERSNIPANAIVENKERILTYIVQYTTVPAQVDQNAR